MKKLIRFITKSILTIIVISFILLGLLWASFNLFLKPKPSISTVKIKNEHFCLGHACRTQPQTLEEYVSLTTQQLAEFYKHRLEFWPRDVYKNNVVYFVSGDKQRAWKINMPNSSYQAINPSNVPNIKQIIGYPDEFMPLHKKEAGEDAFVQVIHERDLLNQKEYENYLYLGTYDKILSYIHEGFHAYGQSGDSWDTPNQIIGNRSRSEHFENIKARAWRVQTLDLLWQALADPSKRNQILRQAVAVYHKYNNRFPKEAIMARYLDRIEGTAYYVETAASLRTSYPEINSIKDQIQAYGFMVKNQNPEKKAGLVNEAYELGAAAGMLLDAIDKNPNQWKKELLADAKMTPMSILASRYSNVDAGTAISPSEQRFIAMETPPKRSANYAGLLTMLYEIIF